MKRERLMYMMIAVMLAAILFFSGRSEGADRGKEIYQKRCLPCHGEGGGGDGPAADTLDPRPRDFTRGLFKFRTTVDGDVPTDDDLDRTIRKGVPTTGMPAFEDVLSKEERVEVIKYIKGFSERFKNAPEVIEMGKPVPVNSESIKKGRELYGEYCSRCHGDNGRGNGEEAMRKYLSVRFNDKWGNPILPRNLTKGWRYKAGNTPKDIFTRISTGINGTPMPSFEDELEEEDRWHIANYVSSLIMKIKEGKIVLKSKFVDKDIPLDVDNPIWGEAEYIDVKLTGQVSVYPRLSNPSIDLVTVRSLYNDKEIAFLLEWDDRIKNTVHDENSAPDFGKTTYPILYPPVKKRPSLRDAVEIQFPVKIPDGPEKPFFILGNPGKMVNLWRWEADKDSAHELNASGYKSSPTLQGSKSQMVKGKGIFKDGRWKVVMKRSIVGESSSKDITFEKGRLIPMAIHAWNGDNNERGLRGSISSWYYVTLEESVGHTLYIKAAIAMILAIGLELYAVKWAGKRG